MGWTLSHTECCSDLFSLPPALGLGSLQTIELLTLGQLLTYPLLEFADRINQVGPAVRGREKWSKARTCNKASQGPAVPLDKRVVGVWHRI